MPDSVLVTCATGKAGFEISRALVDSGFEVYGTTRNSSGAAKLSAIGVKPVIANYTSEVPKALQESGAKTLLFITDYFKAGKMNAENEYQQGVHAIDSAKAAGCTHTIFLSIADAEMPAACKHLLAKPRVEAYLKQSGLKSYSILGPGTFFENFDDPDNYNPLKKGALYFLMTETCKYVATYDLGRAAAVQFKAPGAWHGKKLDCIGWVGDLNDCAAALEKVGGFPVKRGLAMPLFARRLFLPDLDAMCKYFINPGIASNPSDFKKHVPDALDAEGWFKHHGKYANGEPIVGNTSPPSRGLSSLLVPVAVAAVGALAYLTWR